jgi:hypothetical protein
MEFKFDIPAKKLNIPILSEGINPENKKLKKREQ